MAKTPTKKPLDAVEEQARQIVETYLRVPVVQHDDNSQDSMPDLRVEYPDRPFGVVEVVRDIMEERAAQLDALDRKGDHLQVAGLSTVWGVELTAHASVRAVRAALPTLLADVERAGGRMVQATDWPGIDPLGFRIAQLRVKNLFPLNPATPGTSNVILMSPNFFSWDGDPNVIVAWCGALLAQEADVPSKLANSGFTERHAFLVPTMQGDLTIYRALWSKPLPGQPNATPALPTVAPTLPAGVECVWIRGLDRSIAWFMDRGWTRVA